LQPEAQRVAVPRGTGEVPDRSGIPRRRRGGSRSGRERLFACRSCRGGKPMTTRPVLANAGAMSQFVGPFEVSSKLSGQAYQCRFSHMWNGIATRHADTIDTKFFVDGEAHVVGLAHTAFVKFREES